MNGPTLTETWAFTAGGAGLATAQTTFATVGYSVLFSVLSAGSGSATCRLRIETTPSLSNQVDVTIPCVTGSWVVAIALNEDHPASPPTGSATLTVNGTLYATLVGPGPASTGAFLTGSASAGTVSHTTPVGLTRSACSVGGWDTDADQVDLTTDHPARFAIRPPSASGLVRWPQRGEDFIAVMTTNGLETVYPVPVAGQRTGGGAVPEVTVFRRSTPGGAWSVAHRFGFTATAPDPYWMTQVEYPWSYHESAYSYRAAPTTDNGAWSEDKGPLGYWGPGFQLDESTGEVLGIQVTLIRSAPRRTTAKELTCQFLIGGSPVGENRSDGRTYSEDPQRVIYGGPTDLWGRTWTPREINSYAADLALRLEGTTDNAEPVIDVTVEVFWRFRETALHGGLLSGLTGACWLPRMYAVEPWLLLTGVDAQDGYASCDHGDSWRMVDDAWVPNTPLPYALANPSEVAYTAAMHDPLDGRTWGVAFAWTALTGVAGGAAERLVTYDYSGGAFYIAHVIATTPRAAGETNNRPWPFCFRRSDGRLTVGCLIGNAYREWRADDPAGTTWTEATIGHDWTGDAGELDCVSFAEGRSGEQALIGWHPATQSVHVLARAHEDAAWKGPYQPQAVTAAVAPYLVQNPDGTWERGWYLKGTWTQQFADALDAGWGPL